VKGVRARRFDLLDRVASGEEIAITGLGREVPGSALPATGAWRPTPTT
jgi:hypothetical protein